MIEEKVDPKVLEVLKDLLIYYDKLRNFYQNDNDVRSNYYIIEYKIFELISKL